MRFVPVLLLSSLLLSQVAGAASQAVKDLVEFNRKVGDRHLREMERRFKGGGETLTPEQLAQLGLENARVREWCLAEERRIEESYRKLELDRPAPGLASFGKYAEEMRQGLGRFLTHGEEGESTPFNPEALQQRSNLLIQTQRWLRDEEGRLRRLESLRGGPGQSVARGDEPPQIRELIAQAESALQPPAEAQTIDDWKAQVDHQISQWERIVEYRRELLGRFAELKAQGVTTPEAVEKLTAEHSRVIERAALELFQIRKDPAMRERAVHLQNVIQRLYVDIAVAHDAEWNRRQEAWQRERVAMKRKELGIKALEGANVAFIIGCGICLVGSFGGCVMGPYSTEGTFIGTGFASVVAGIAALVSAAHVSRKVVNVSDARVVHSRVPPASLPEPKMKSTVLNHLKIPEGHCLREAFGEILTFKGAAQGAELAAAALAGGESRVRVGTGDSAPDPLGFIRDPVQREAAERKMAEIEAEEVLREELARCGRQARLK